MAVLAVEPAPEVRLRPAVPRDAELLRRWRAEPEVRRFQPLADLTVGQLRTDIASHRLPDLYRGRGEKFQWVIEVGREPAGWITLVVANWEHGLCELGFALSSPFQNRGIMPLALAQLVPELFLHTTLYRIEARCSVENFGSQRVLEKSRFQREGLLRGYFILDGRRVDHYLYSLLRHDYLP